MEKEFAKFLAGKFEKDGLMFVPVGEFSTLKNCNLDVLNGELKQYGLKIVTADTADADEKFMFGINMLKNNYFLKRI